MAASRSRTKPKAAARPRARAGSGSGARAAPRRRPAKRRSARPVLEQRHLDLLGLGCVALAVFLGFVLYRGRDGGRAGDELVGGLLRVVGDLAYAVPVALVAIGAVLVLRPVLPTVRPFRSGGLCLLAGGVLWLGADHGGSLGDTVEGAVETLVGTFGADLLAVFLFAAAVLLLTGATIAGVVRGMHGGVSDTTRVLRTAATAVPARSPRRPVRTPPVTPPEPPESEITVRPLDPQGPDPWMVVGEEGVSDPDEEGSDPSSEDDADLTVQGSVPLTVNDEEVEDGLAGEHEPEHDDAGDASPRVYGPEDLTPQGRLRAHVTDDPAFLWHVPPPSLLQRSSAEQARPDTAGQAETARSLVEALSHYGIQAQVIGTVAGPHITRYEVRLAPGVKMSKVANLKDDLAYALAAADIRILAPIPGKQAVGVEVPNARRKVVQLGDVMPVTPPEGWSPLSVWLGKDVAGKPVGADLAKMPHLLVAGTTGAGKSACVNAMLASILLRATPHEVRLVLVDPKQVELNHYDGIPHLLTPVITSPRMAANALQNLVREMEDRYGRMSLARTRNLPELNRVREERGEPALPYVLCVIDELADLMMVAPADVEDSIIRLAQKARAVGIHLVLATQSPRVDVITGMIKANVPSRIAFAVSSQTDSRVILDQNGAESLLGKGDMLFSPVGTSRLQRIQGAWIDEPQIEAITDEWRRQGEPELREDLLEEVEDESTAGSPDDPDDFDPDEDPLLEEAIVLVAEMGTASTSMLQRRLRLGYTRAGRLIDMLERRGVISGYEGSKPRQVLVGPGDVPRFIAALRGGATEDEPTPVGDPGVQS